MNKEVTKENVLSAMRKSKFRKRAINKITLDLGLDPSKDKEYVRKVLHTLKDDGYLYTELGDDGVTKWCLKEWSFNNKNL